MTMLTKLEPNTNPHEPIVPLCFEAFGSMVVNPLYDVDGTTPVNPEHYGFEIWHTGGGCTAHCREFTLEGRKVVMMLTDGNLSHIESESDQATVCVFTDESLEDCISYWEISR
jgi:hypothetical protein